MVPGGPSVVPWIEILNTCKGNSLIAVLSVVLKVIFVIEFCTCSLQEMEPNLASYVV